MSSSSQLADDYELTRRFATQSQIRCCTWCVTQSTRASRLPKCGNRPASQLLEWCGWTLIRAPGAYVFWYPMMAEESIHVAYQRLQRNSDSLTQALCLVRK